MALIKCPGCGNDVSTHSTECPKCGEPVHCQMLTEEERRHKKKERLKKDMTVYLFATGILSGISIFELLVGNIPRDYKIYNCTLPSILILAYSIRMLIQLKKTNKD